MVSRDKRHQTPGYCAVSVSGYPYSETHCAVKYNKVPKSSALTVEKKTLVAGTVI